ncbi:uncharacterized protein BX663DRAFT_515077 [Cokeromyces recurvatus]|uniref:uncharacterized protein n=1 Tax=Cokeromyces recurvatus TaxID=90255 RepID=UPI00221F54CA|nr:uncharacterized protein BX663DRAFT_515077 [Cokeromyces recurvatus]KAI7901139.1 hypothetical protein BX663DRAFT_515077 [Cokeromyces recurvatus]
MKITLYILCLMILALSLCEAGSYQRTKATGLEIFAKREENCDVSCTGELSNCAERCRRSRVASIVGDLRVVCQEGVCYCGFEVGSDNNS